MNYWKYLVISSKLSQQLWGPNINENKSYLFLDQKTSQNVIACHGAIFDQLMSSNMWTATSCPEEYRYSLTNMTMFWMLEDPKSRYPSLATKFKLEIFTGEQLVLWLSLTRLEPWKTLFGRQFDNILRILFWKKIFQYIIKTQICSETNTCWN